MGRPFYNDIYAPLSHKADLGDGLRRPIGAPSWVDNIDARRLVAYEILAAYRENTTRYHLPSLPPSLDPDDSSWRKLREYGHGSLLVQQARALLLGDDQTISVPDADNDFDEDDTDGAIKKAHDAAAPFAEWLEQWAEDEHLPLKLLEMEENAVGDGDGVFSLGWDPTRNRPRLKTWDPGWYFPDLSSLDTDNSITEGTSTDADYPSTVHFAWEFVNDQNVPMLRRITYQLTNLIGVDITGEPILDDAGVPVAAGRGMPWDTDPDEEGTFKTCLISDRTWDISNLGEGHFLPATSSQMRSVYNLDPAAAVNTRLDNVDMHIDFIPVVHVPNDAAGNRFFGRSVVLRIAQILDDIAATDTDLQANSALVGSTPTVVTGGSGVALEGGPGAQWGMPAGANVQMLDTSKNLDAQLKYTDHLLELLSVNSRLAGALLGRVSPDDVPSGYAMELGFAPTRSLVGEMRAVRKQKYGLLCKFAMRMAQVGAGPGEGEPPLPPGPTPAAEIMCGNFLPADKESAAKFVKDLLYVHGMSLRTAVLTLIEAGFPIDDAEQEIERIKSEWHTAAVQLADATGDQYATRSWLGLPTTGLPIMPPPPPAPIIVVPGQQPVKPGAEQPVQEPPLPEPAHPAPAPARGQG